MMAESLIFDAGWIFFAAWGMILAAMSAVAFGRDFLNWLDRLVAHH
jgi:hypothetical protein